MDHHHLARSLAAGRVVAGLALLLTPRLAARIWLGAALPKGGGPAVLVRALGIRDLALGVGTLRALERGEDAAPWVEVSAVCDLVDGAATVAGVRGPEGLRPLRALPAVATAVGSGAVGLSAAAALRR